MPEAAEEQETAEAEEQPEWRKQAPVLRLRLPAPKKASRAGPRTVARRESPFGRGSAGEAGEAPAAPGTPEPSLAGLPDPERVEGLAEAAFRQLRKAEAKVAEAGKASLPLTPGAEDIPQEKANEAARETQKAVEAAIQAIQGATRCVVEKSLEMGKTDAAIRMKSSLEFLGLQGKFKGFKSRMEELRAAVAVVVSREVPDEKKDKEEHDIFEAYDLDQDGWLSAKEVSEFSRSEYQFVPTEEQVGLVIKSLAGENPGVPFEKLQRLRCMIAVNRSASREQEREARRAEVLESGAQVERAIKAAEAISSAAAKSADRLEDEPLRSLRAAVERTEAEVKEARTKVEEAEAVLAKLYQADDAPQDEAVRSFRDELGTRFKLHFNRIKEMTQSVPARAESAKKRFGKADSAELEALRVEAARAVRAGMHDKRRAPGQVFEQAAGAASSLAREPFVAFLRSLDALCPVESLPECLRRDMLDDARIERLFEHAADGEDALSKERFERLFTCLSYLVLKPTALMEGKPGGDSAEKRRLGVGESLEALELVELKEADATYVHCRACKDGAEGWAMVTDTSGAAFVEACGCLHVCVKETILTAKLSISDGETVRRLQKGELLQALGSATKDESCGIVRVECRALRDGRRGWASVVGSTGVAFLKVLR